MTTKTKQSKEEKYQKNLNILINAFRDALAAWNSGERWHVSISKGNIKMGDVPSVSTLPLVTCPKVCRETCGKEGCYAEKIACLRPNVARSYARNTVYRLKDPTGYYEEIHNFIRFSGCRSFRFHVSGEMTRYSDMLEIAVIAEYYPNCDILVFTKQFEIVNSYIDYYGELPGNLHIVFSEWDGLEVDNPYSLPTARVLEKGKEVPENIKICGGNCFECFCRGVGCWELKQGETIGFYKH